MGSFVTSSDLESRQNQRSGPLLTPMSDEFTPETNTPELTEATAAPPVAKKKAAAGALSFKVSAKGAVSVYGLGRFPVTLYYEQWKRLLGSIEPLQAFLEENKSQLKSKEEA